MSTEPYVHQPYPKVRYHFTGKTMTVTDPSDEEKLTPDTEWADHPNEAAKLAPAAPEPAAPTEEEAMNAGNQLYGRAQAAADQIVADAKAHAEALVAKAKAEIAELLDSAKSSLAAAAAPKADDAKAGDAKKK